MSIQEAQPETVRHSAAAPGSVDLGERCGLLGLPAPREGALRFRAFGQNLVPSAPRFDLLQADTGQPARLGDHIVVLHYLQCGCRIAPTGELIIFRDVPGGHATGRRLGRRASAAWRGF